MRRPLLAAAMAVALLGCSHQAPSRQLGALRGQKVTVTPAGGGAEVEGVLDEAPEGLYVRTPHGAIALADAKQITVVHRARGAFEGMGTGALIGILAGVIVGYSSGDDECGGEFCLFELSAGEKATLAAVGLGGLGALGGLLVGAAIGSRDVYDLDRPAPRVLPSGPPGSVIGATVRF